jgi:hypothetical protein
MKNLLLKFFPLILCFGLFINVSAQGKIIAALDFNPNINGFSFPNYKNEGSRWKDDIAADDLIRMFGVNAVCKNKSATNCVLKADARAWLERQLKAMDIGHCEGIAVASLRMNNRMPFKKRATPANFQTGASSPFNLKLAQPLENYIAYYWITQTFDEVSVPSKETAQRGPLEIVKMLINGMKSKQDTYLLSFWKPDNGRLVDGHAVTPFAVADGGNQYIIYVYDNNFPGETRYLFVNKDNTQTWSYSAEPKPNNANPDYIGNFKTQTLQLTATSWREGKCFDASFAEDEDKAVGCGNETASLNRSIFKNASFHPKSQAGDADGEDAEFFLTDEGDMLVIDGEGRRVGYDPSDDGFYEDVPDSNAQFLIGGLGLDAPHYTMPYENSDKPYTIVFSGNNLEQESIMDFVFSAPGFTVGFDGIRLDPGETLTATISHNGEQITFKASADGETPDVFYAFDSDEEDNASYIAEIGGVSLEANKDLTYDFDFENGKLFFSDDDGNKDQYDINLTRINADGTEDVYEQDDLDIGKADKYEMDFGKWDGKGQMCFKDDEDGDGFDDEQCVEEPNEKP